jgi:hypothetical protein
MFVELVCNMQNEQSTTWYDGRCRETFLLLPLYLARFQTVPTASLALALSKEEIEDCEFLNYIIYQYLLCRSRSWRYDYVGFKVAYHSVVDEGRRWRDRRADVSKVEVFWHKTLTRKLLFHVKSNWLFLFLVLLLFLNPAFPMRPSGSWDEVAILGTEWRGVP